MLEVDNFNKQTPIFLTGCARSGTSVTSSIIAGCGAFGGIVSGPNNWNKKGMYENSKIRDGIVKPYLRGIGVDPLGQNPLPNIHNLQSIPTLKKQITNIMVSQGYNEGPWFYKGAKLCLIWPIWNEAFPNAKWIIVRRKDEDIAESCLRTAFMRAFSDKQGWINWVEEHKKRFEEMKIVGMDVFEVWPEKFIVDGDFSEMRKCVEHVGLEWNDEVISRVCPQYWRKGESYAQSN